MGLIKYLQISIGIACIIVGGADDSPGLQGIGLFIIGWTVYRLVKLGRGDK